MRSSNPVMTGKIYERAGGVSAGASVMTINGTINKIGLMLMLVIGAAAYIFVVGDVHRIEIEYDRPVSSRSDERIP